MRAPQSVWCVVAGVYIAALGAVSLRADQQAPPTSLAKALPAHPTGEDIYRATCLACHGPDGKGQPRSVVGFDTPLPDFTNCGFATAEPDPDWHAVVHEGGRVRGLSRHMPSYATALSDGDIDAVIGYVRGFCTEPKWPRGDLNFPRAMFTEKAFPENEAVWTTTFSGGDGHAVENVFVYERRLGARSQIEIVAPVNFLQQGDDTWRGGLGDVAVAFRHTFYASLNTVRIAAAGVEVAFPTGYDAFGFGNGFTVYEPFAMWGQALPRNSFLQMHGGAEIPSNSTEGSKELYLRTAIGTTLAGNHGFGRSWSPQLEVLWARPSGEDSEWDLVPQLQVSLSKLQHVIVAGGVRIPLTARDERRTQVVGYFLWDWFDGSLFEFWK